MNSDKSDGANEKSRAIDIARDGGGRGRCVSKRVDEGLGDAGNEMDGSMANIKQTTLLTLWIRLIALAACAAVLSRPDILPRCAKRRRDGKGETSRSII